MRVYLDNCCFNRPFDNQLQLRIKLETEAKLHIQDLIRSLKIELVWSYILDYENDMNPFKERRYNISLWKPLAVTFVSETDDITNEAEKIKTTGIKPKDSLHLACAKAAQCDYFFTTDDVIIKRRSLFNDIAIMNPVEFITGEQK